MDNHEVVEQDGALTLQGDVLVGAEEAFREMRYIEAFALLHAYIDWWMTDNIQLRVKTPFNRKYRFMTSAKLLKNELKIINEDEYERLRSFDELRNIIIHRLVRYSYQHYPINYKNKNNEVIERSRITKPEVINAFEEGKKLANLLKGKTSSAFKTN